MIALIANWLGLLTPAPACIPVRNRRVGGRS